uniref:PhoH-like protein n=1 Tax=Paulinella longichromatophora TaxID=1708747 RepID=A0A2H4ZP01_9EUKA|nr:PhoH-like phosphate starvation-inducible protein [Paulinella longichromatophora]
MTEAESLDNSNSQFVVDLPDQSAAISLTGGPSGVIRRQLEKVTGASIVLRGLQLIIKGRPDQLEEAVGLIELLRHLWEEGKPITTVDVVEVLGSSCRNGVLPELEYFDQVVRDKPFDLKAFTQKVLAKTQSGQLIRPKTIRQGVYLDAMERNDLTLALGPTGTGKTFLAIILAVRMLSERKVKRIIFSRLTIKPGEYRGFSSGNSQQKFDPSLSPLYDSLHMLLGVEKTSVMIGKGLIEIVPIDYMRGRTLADAFIIIDDAQHTTTAQMRMLLTRLGENSRMVVAGDLTQVDSSKRKSNGLVEATQVLKGVKHRKIYIMRLSTSDVVRHPLVRKIIEVYSLYDQDRSPDKIDTL